MGAASYPQFRKSKHHLSIDKMTYRDCIGEGPIYGSWHGEDSRSLHIRKDVDPIKPDHTYHQHPKDSTKLDRFPTSPRSNSTSHCRSLCTEATDHQTSQPMKTRQIIVTIETRGIFCTYLFLRDEETFCSWGRCRKSKLISRLEQ